MIDFGTLFPVEDHVCCSCCEGFCAMDEVEMKPNVMRIHHAGLDYLTDRYVMVRLDKISGAPELELISPRSIAMGYPAKQPPASLAWFTPHLLRHVINADLTVCGTERSGLQHLYQGDQHVGWVMARNSPRGDDDPCRMLLTDIDEVSAFADSLTWESSLTAYPDLWDRAVFLRSLMRGLRTSGADKTGAVA